MKRSKRPAGEFTTYTVRRSWPAMRAPGEYALLLETDHGIIAIRIDPAVVAAIRSALQEAEILLNPPTGRA